MLLEEALDCALRGMHVCQCGVALWGSIYETCFERCINSLTNACQCDDCFVPAFAGLAMIGTIAVHVPLPIGSVICACNCMRCAEMI